MSINGPVAILGLGLVGGSLARDLAASGVTVWGFDVDSDATRHAFRTGVISKVVDSRLRALEDARTIVLAVPVDEALTLLEQAAPHLRRAALITDVGSTKRRIVQRASALGLASRFVGSHPMAGDHRAGWHASRRGLFEGARVDLCRTPDTSAAVWKRARALWRAVGAKPTERDAAMHDAEMALSSHLPQLLSLALAGTLASRAIERRRLGSGGKEMTRMAASSVEMWAAILDDNAVPVLDALETCLAQLGALRGAVERHDRRAVAEAFSAARAWSDKTS
ncbi:MAG: prephenate dehydrogenase/arogenate dehydrogenase family protein [Gemmatimonadaceae bacterium]